MSVLIESHAAELQKNNILLIFSEVKDKRLLNEFYGAVLTLGAGVDKLPELSGKNVYICGDVSRLDGKELIHAHRVLVIRELAENYVDNGHWTLIDLGQVPVDVCGMGVFYRCYFKSQENFYNSLIQEHEFQSLTESNKPGTAHRKGIYLTPVTKDKDEFHFNLLRCSTNLSGPTDNFKSTDKYIVDLLNLEAASVFHRHAPFNHVLAQLYANTPATDSQKETKAKISNHSDKTKDMPVNGVMAFCTFYNQLEKLTPIESDPFDYGFKNVSGLTKLHFRLKKTAKGLEINSLPDEFILTLYPGSVFFMPLSTNRLYTHEIKSSMLSAEYLPTRLGYVVRCSSTQAVNKNGKTYLKVDGQLKELEPPTEEGISELRKMYALENRITDFIDYGNKFLFSMNKGDYLVPLYDPADEFRQYSLTFKENIFKELSESVTFEEVGKGRLGAVLLKKDGNRGFPLVRTTTKYETPSQVFKGIHSKLAKKVQSAGSLGTELNNALIERYNEEYSKMGFHSDQSLDLKDDSYIAIYSCYENPELAASRKLVVESKEVKGENFEIILEHNSVIIFSTCTNLRFRHKIVPGNSLKNLSNEWMGVTFRTSKTFVNYEEKASFENNSYLTLATDDQCKEFYR